MKLSAIALKNLKRNFSFYSLYLFSVSFVLMIYFCFTSFSMNQIIMEKISSDGRVETMCRTVAVFIMAFVIFYMFYSNSFFMRRRMRELGIYSLLGYRKSTILKLLIFENVMICFGGMILGILTGSILHKIVIAGIVTLLGISVDQSAIPLIYPAAVKAILSFVIVVLITLTLSNARLLRKSTLPSPCNNRVIGCRISQRRIRPCIGHYAGKAVIVEYHWIFSYCHADTSLCCGRNDSVYVLIPALCLSENPAEKKQTLPWKYHYCSAKVYAPHPF